MIYNETDGEEYKIRYYADIRTGKSPVRAYIKSLPPKDRAKVYKYIELLRASEGYLSEPYSKHIDGKIRELIVDFARNRHRIFYFIFIKKTIIMLHAFLKKTPQTPPGEIKKAKENYLNILKG
ncbi:MAG: addiction module toxin RelE [Candidatus Portnoybacteria bacterium CG23_combo_of_CG06-09_8_20_14_all_37_13]|uniref:Addiction module toxin RelE n=1 Tax=Candidatus Portnoybacteria bacterium CG23_combo_of_CG06-09_8_20_14_all_37_13 TaxID=1974819 RepID=A0A2G9YF37_9BACT|nr:MAG: addiction module toxin RelE [Candidatus Portnoybacteria bacterium CG23_combo_of_CG06-09_8_20_14_all_37_13]